MRDCSKVARQIPVSFCGHKKSGEFLSWGFGDSWRRPQPLCPGGQHDRHTPTPFEARTFFDLTDVFQLPDNFLQHLTTAVVVRVFAAPEDDVELNFVFVRQEFASLLDLEVNVVLTDFWSKTNFLELNLMGFRRSRMLLLLLVFKLAVVHDSADGRALVGRNLNKIQTDFKGCSLGIRGRNDPQHLSFLVHHPHRRKPDLFVHTMRRFDSSRLLLVGTAIGSHPKIP